MKKGNYLPFYILFIFFSFFHTTHMLAQQDSAEVKDQKFVFPHTLNRIFSVPSSKIMNSLDLSFFLGGSFGFADNTGVLGNIGLGLGGYGDVEISSESLLGSMIDSKESFTNIGMKVKILSEGEKFPALAIGIKTNNEWNSSRNDSELIRTHQGGLYASGLRTANYDSRMTSVYAAIGKTFISGLTLNAGINLSDLRYKNVYVVFNEGNSSFVQEDQERETVINFFGGFEYPLNERTILMFELQSYPYLKVNTLDGTLSSSRRIVSVAGLRFFISNWLLVDSGIRYQDNYSGLAEAEIRLGLNGMWNLGF
ncbi:MAG: hypothetical protein IIA49_10980 [Bacteroidetes bacterium]|nr:hypothetical protein [Bacteroidota bacterium]MCH7771518.1 hypothetical protein [Bacteroidota bacterium]